MGRQDEVIRNAQQTHRPYPHRDLAAPWRSTSWSDQSCWTCQDFGQSLQRCLGAVSFRFGWYL